MPKYLHKKNQKRNKGNNARKNKQQKQSETQLEQEKLKNSNENATGICPEINEKGEIDSQCIETLNRSHLTDFSEKESKIASDNLNVHDNKRTFATDLKDLANFSDSCEVTEYLNAAGDFINKTGASNSVEEKANTPSENPKQNNGDNKTIELEKCATSISLSSSSSESTLKAGEDSPDKEITEVFTDDNDNDHDAINENIIKVEFNNGSDVRKPTTVNIAIETLDAVKENENSTPSRKSEEITKKFSAVKHPIVQEVITTLYSYRVESPKPIKPKTLSIKKSRSLDDDEVMIQEMSDNSSAGDSTDNLPLVSEAESEADSEATLENIENEDSRIISITTLPLDSPEAEIIRSQEIISREITNSEEKSLCNQDFKARRAQKRAALETHFMPQFLNPRYLDSIKEENSDVSDIERKSDSLDSFSQKDFPSIKDLDDDVFIESDSVAKKANAVFPKSNLDFSQRKKHMSNLRPPKTSVIREESPCFVVEAKIVEQESVEESCSTWTTDTVQESNAAEIVYIDSASSSSSDLVDLDYIQGNDADIEDSHEDTDVHIETPTIDVDGEHIFRNSPTPTCEERNTNEVEQTVSFETSGIDEKGDGSEIIEIENNSQNLIVSDNHQQSCKQDEFQRSPKNSVEVIEEIHCISSVDSEENSKVSETDKSENNFKISDSCSSEMFASNNQIGNDNDNSNKVDHAIAIQSNDIKSSDKELVRQDSSGSHGSEQSQSTTHSQCTAINKESVPYNDLADFDMPSYVSGSSTVSNQPLSTNTAVKSLRQLCIEALASMPYGKDVLEELASVAQSLSNLTQKHQALKISKHTEMPYPVPDLPRIDDLKVYACANKPHSMASGVKIVSVPPPNDLKSPPPIPPPPVPESIKETSWFGVPTEDPNILVCLSPSQKEYLKETKTLSERSAESLLDMHKKFVERRGYHELTKEQVNNIEQEKFEKSEKVLPSAQLRNSTTPPPVPPPPLLDSLNETDTITTTSNGDKNNHRLLAIIRDSKQCLNENTSGKIEQVGKSETVSVPRRSHRSDQETQTAKAATTNTKETTTTFKQEQKQLRSEKKKDNMPQAPFGQQDFPNFPEIETPFKVDTKRFSSIETPTSPFCSQLMQTIPKRYSNIETSSYESRKRIENGKVVYEFCDSNKEKFTDASDNAKGTEVGSTGTGIKSDIKLESEALKNQKDYFSHNFINKRKENEKPHTSASDFSYDEFRQRAKETAKKTKSEFFNRDKLFKDFDDISKYFQEDISTSRGEKQNIRSKEFEIPINIENKANVWEEFDKKFKNEPQKKEKGETIYHIPITLEDQQNIKAKENYSSHTQNQQTKETKKCEEKIIPIKVEKDFTSKSKPSIHFDKYDNSRYQEEKLTEKRLSSQNLEEWMKYAELEASSENITKPFMKELEICHGKRSNVRAPSLSPSISHLKRAVSHDEFRRNYELCQTPTPARRQRYTSCHSMIDQTPITQYVSPYYPRRSSLPKEIHDVHLDYIKQKEEELKIEFEKLESDRRRLLEEMDKMQESPRLRKDSFQYRSCRLPTLSENEAFRQQMHDEWMSKVAEREERRLHKIIKISKPSEELGSNTIPSVRKSSSTADISDEFLQRVRERRSKLCMPSDSDWESGAESQPIPKNNQEDQDKLNVKIIEGQKVADFKQLPKHLQEFAELTSKFEEKHEEEKSTYEKSSYIKKDGVWSPGNKYETSERKVERTKTGQTTPTVPTPPPLPVWSPQPSPPTGRKEFRPVKFSSPVLPRRYVREESTTVAPPWSSSDSKPFLGYQSSSCSNINTVGTEKRFIRSTSDISQQFKEIPIKSSSQTEPERPKVPKDDSPAFVRPNEVIYSVKHEYMSEPESENDRPKKMAQLSRRQFDGIGPTTKDGMPIVLRSEIKENNQHQWYKRMYNTLHKAKDSGRYPYKSNGYISEPEAHYDSDYSATMKYNTIDRRRAPSTGTYNDDRNYGTMPNPVKSGSGSYKNQPGRIEDYIPGHSSVSEKEKKEWWDEVMEIFDGHLEQQKLSSNYTEGYLSRALKEQGYESDSNLVFRKKEESQFAPLSPVEQKQAYRNVQAGGEPPLQGFRKPAPEKPKETDVIPPMPPTKGASIYENGRLQESPHRYFETDVNIHYKTPIRYEYKEAIPEEELARRQAESMKKLYQEERRRKYLQELQDMNSRRHTDNFTPSQKSPIPLNRYDDFNADISPKSPVSSTYPKTVARALYNFQGQTARELTFKKGDVIYIRRQIDKNWYEGEHNAMIGLLPANYVEIISKDGVRQPPKKPSEGQARAKFNFQAQSAIELSLNKGELVTLTRRVDENWFEGKIANRKGIFPVSYVEVLTDIGAEDYNLTPTQSKPVGAPASHSLITHPTTTSPDTQRTNIVNNNYNNLTNGQPPSVVRQTTVQKTEVLHVDTNSEPIAYRALYKYRPQNNDELELHEGDIVYVLEKCDDGWYVGTSQRTGYFGTFPGNYVERI